VRGGKGRAINSIAPEMVVTSRRLQATAVLGSEPVLTNLELVVVSSSPCCRVRLPDLYNAGLRSFRNPFVHLSALKG
jgi:hypothetical protein